MGFTKYQKTESSADVVSPKGHKAISEELHKVGKTSAADLSKGEREAVSRKASEDLTRND